MADISQITLPSGTTYDIKDAVARAAQGNARVYYAECSTGNNENQKIVTGVGTPQKNDILFIKFIYGNNITTNFRIKIGIAPYPVSTTVALACPPNEIVGFIYDGERWIMIESGLAAIDYYGITKLSNDIDSTSVSLAATSKAVKDALDAAKAYADGLDTGVSDVTVDGTSVVSSGVAAIDLSGKVDKVTGKGLSTNDYTTTEKNKLAGIEAGADVNTIESISVNGTTITPDATKNVAITIPAGVDSVNGVAGNVQFDFDVEHQNGSLAEVTEELYLNTTISNGETEDVVISTEIPVATTDGNGLMSKADKIKLNGIAAGAEVNVQANWTQTTTTADDYIKNKPTLGAAAAKGVDTSIAASTTSTNLPTSAAVETRIQAAIAEAEVGSAAFQGVINSNTAISGLSDYKKGWYWVVGTAGEYLIPSGETEGETCEVGDFIFCISDRASAYAPADFKVVQANIDMSQFGNLAYKDTATGNVSVTSSDAVTSVSHGLDSATASGDDTVLKDVTNAAPTFTGTQKYLHLSTTKDTVTSTGSASLTTSDAVTAVSGSVNTTSTNGIDIKPAGTVSTPTITVTPSTTTINNPTSVTVAKTIETAQPTETAPSNQVTYCSVSGETLSLYKIGYTTGDSITTSSQTVATGIQSATSTQPSFTGTQKYLHLSTTKDTVTSTGSISVTTSGAVTAVSGSVNTTATDGIDIKPAGSVSAPTLTKTYVKPKVTATKGTTTSTGTVTVS